MAEVPVTLRNCQRCWHRCGPSSSSSDTPGRSPTGLNNVRVEQFELERKTLSARARRADRPRHPLADAVRLPIC
jgi:hypothetical protein